MMPSINLGVSTTIDVDGVRRYVKAGYWILKHIGVLAKDVPVGCLYAIPRLATIDSSKVEWTVDESIMVSNVDPFL